MCIRDSVRRRYITHRSNVEAIPAEPENEGTKNLQGDGVAWELPGLSELISSLVVETSLTGTEDLGSDDGSDPPRHMDDATSGKINHAHT